MSSVIRLRKQVMYRIVESRSTRLISCGSRSIAELEGLRSSWRSAHWKNTMPTSARGERDRPSDQRLLPPNCKSTWGRPLCSCRMPNTARRRRPSADVSGCPVAGRVFRSCQVAVGEAGQPAEVPPSVLALPAQVPGELLLPGQLLLSMREHGENSASPTSGRAQKRDASSLAAHSAGRRSAVACSGR
jgi:hypothetical protein